MTGKITVTGLIMGLTLLANANVFAQKGTLVGSVQDGESGTALDFAAVSIYSQTDTSLVTGGITELDGTFKIDVDPGNYLLKVEYISYAPLWVNDVVAVAGMETDLGTVTLLMSAAMLDEIEIVEERSEFQLGLDKKVFNVGKDLVTRSGSAADVLDNIPAVAVDLDGNVSLRGSNNVRVLIDGRPSGLVGLSGNDALRALQGDLIERVEVITNPSARYDAEGMSGIINIILKKDKRKGVNGSFNANFSYPLGYGGSASMNVRRKDVNFFANYGYQFRTSPGGGNLYQEYYGLDTTYLIQTRERERQGHSHNIQFGMDWFVNPRNTLTGSFLYRYGTSDNSSLVTYDDFNPNFELIGISTRTENEEEIEPTLEYNLDYKHTFPKKGHEIKAALQFQDSEETENAKYLEQSFEPDGTPGETPDLNQRSANVESQTQWLGQVDYINPITENGKLEAGYRGTYRGISNDFLVEEFVNNEWMRLDGLSNFFLYDETVHAAYALYGDKRGKFSYQAGLRMEYSRIVTELVETNEINDRNYNNLFPSAHIGYEMEGENTFQVSYSRRIRRPRFWYLNPFVSFSDSRNLWVGNPNLDPEYTSSYEINHIKYWEKSSLSSSLYYRHTTDVIQRIRSINDEGVTVTRPENLATRDAWGLDLTFSTPILKNWKVDGNVNIFREITKSPEYGDADTYSWQGRINSRVTLFGDVETQLRLNYRGPRETNQGRSKDVFFADIGISKDIFNKNATITLNVRDVFNSRKRRYIAQGEGFYSEGDFQWRARQTTLTLSYRLNQKKRQERNRGGYDGGDGEF